MRFAFGPKFTTALVALALAGACSGSPARRARPVIVFALDGADMDVLARLWSEGELPNLRSLAQRGTAGVLRTAYGKSPVIWTTIATGRRPEDHGITGFLIETPDGTFHASTSLRRAPALWNILDRQGRRTAVLGWWPSWPVEPIDGVMVSDRVRELPVEQAVYPPEFLPRFRSFVEASREDDSLLTSNENSRVNDRLIAYTARRLVDEGFDLVLIYFREIDVMSHLYWHEWEPEAFEGSLLGATDTNLIAGTYRAVDSEIGRILSEADPDADVIVISDHGFHAAPDSPVTVSLEIDPVLERLDLLAPSSHGEPGCGRGAVHSIETVPSNPRKGIVLCRPEERDAVEARLASALNRVTYLDGSPVFSIDEPLAGEERQGAHLVVVVATDTATKQVLVDGVPDDDIVQHVGRVTGDHGEHDDGVFLAAGPDIASGADISGISIHDVAPTVLYALGEPVAEDFAGRAWQELFTPGFRRKNPLRTVATWGTTPAGQGQPTEADRQREEQLRGLGYLN